MRIPASRMKISKRPRSMPAISTIKASAGVAGPVMPIDNPTVPSAEAKSNIASINVQFAVSISRNVPPK